MVDGIKMRIIVIEKDPSEVTCKGKWRETWHSILCFLSRLVEEQMVSRCDLTFEAWLLL